MPSSAGRYRSRLFNFVSRQTRRWIDRGERATRQVTTATVWGVQILVYPIYLLFQSARLAGKQLQHFLQGLTGSQSDLQPLPADTPIQNVLETVKSLALPANLSNTNLPESLSGSLVNAELVVSTEKSGILTVENPSLHHQEIQGIATLPENRLLVLINRQNQILDVLSQQQQKQLEKQISLELAQYWHHQRLVQDALRPTMYLPPPASSENALPPIRLWQNFMAWMQRGKVAGAINLFQEETLQLHQDVKNRELQYRTQQLKQRTQELKERQQALNVRTQNQLGLESIAVPEVNDTSFLAKVDRAIAIIETGSLAVANVPGYLVHRSQDFSQLFKARMQESLTEETNYSPDLKLRIEVLIKAAVEYFFSSRRTAELTAEDSLVNPNNSNSDSSDIDFWLTEEDLFSQSVPLERELQQFEIASQDSGVLTQEKAATSNLIQTTVFSPALTENSLSNSSNSDTNNSSNFIEIQATPTGYIKHPLEEVLEILDRTMFFIEELLLTLWREIQHIFR
ncbi:hypothetical protein IQ264_13455 [Phormidium sp. LEGE 05292]|uniref:hypothetical protein n=1 Tax=[Phormidium] sp. LEGE 05292 TaxID=767427 RepID=UPI001881EE38|nr:hypothetical protein [Phormidium sp. LEGE 05292]MBE9226429.1 hypothetical protein [Phormidium sp. LEGE 05292]